LRIPGRRHDRHLHEAVAAALRGTGVRLELGRPAGAARDTVIEIGSDPRSWTVLPADQITEIGATRVAAISFEPPLTITGSVLVPERGPGHAARCAAPAFGGAPTGPAR
jgi:hypothetical protein